MARTRRKHRAPFAWLGAGWIEVQDDSGLRTAVRVRDVCAVEERDGGHAQFGLVLSGGRIVVADGDYRKIRAEILRRNEGEWAETLRRNEGESR